MLTVFLLADLMWSFNQYLHQPLDGDMPRGIVPAEDVRPMLNDPIGVQVVLYGARYQNPNRFFSGRLFHDYFRSVPLFLQHWLDPIASVYWSAALAKLGIHIALLILLAAIVIKASGLHKRHMVVVMALLSPFFQTNGYRSYIGIIDPANTYAFYYALPSIYLLAGFYILLSVRGIKAYESTPLPLRISWWLLGLVTCFSGPLNPPVIILCAGLLLGYGLWKQDISVLTLNEIQHGPLAKPAVLLKGLPGWILPWFITALYSQWLGTYSLENQVNIVPVSERYALLFIGLGKLFTGKLGLPLFAGSLGFLYWLLYQNWKEEKALWLLRAFRYFGIFALLWLILLPWGGYREWRPYYIRYDTLIPLTLGMIILYGSSAIFLLHQLTGMWRTGLIAFLIGIWLIYTAADGLDTARHNCERKALTELSQPHDSPLLLLADCPVLSWQPVSDPEQSVLISELLLLWRIRSEPTLFYQIVQE